jgi:hypothetical protein
MDRTTDNTPRDDARPVCPPDRPVTGCPGW